jgi:hypothetical protein
MFAVVNDVEKTAVFVKLGEVGFWPCKPEHEPTWSRMHHAQGEAVTAAAKAGSILGWNVPAARAAVEAARATP